MHVKMRDDECLHKVVGSMLKELGFDLSNRGRYE